MIAPAALADRLELLLTHATGCTATFTQYAGIEALTGPQDFVTEMVREYQRRRDRMLELVNAIPGVHAKKPQGAFYIFPNVSSYGLSSKEIATRLINEAGVAVLAGTDFGDRGVVPVALALECSGKPSHSKKKPETGFVSGMFCHILKIRNTF